jgi:hypothetical protein
LVHDLAQSIREAIMANHSSKYPERLLLAISPAQKAKVQKLAERDQCSVASIVRRALNRELTAA